MEVTANSVQTVAPGGNVVFTSTPVKGRCNAVINRADSGVLTLRGGAAYRCTFGANIGLPDGGTSGPLTLAMAIDGEPVATSTIKQTVNVGEACNVSRSLNICIPAGCCYTLAVQNTSGQAVDVANANLIVERG